MTVKEWVLKAAWELTEPYTVFGAVGVRLEAQLLAAHVLGVDRIWVLTNPDADFPELAGEALLQRRRAGEPLPYLLGYREFYGRRFTVNPAVLIPRPETETLVEAVLEQGFSAGTRVLDIGTGSGAIAVTLALERPDWEVSAVDLSPEALQVARRNAEDLGAKVRFLEADLFPDLDVDVIVTNPPYVAEDDELGPGVREFEPHLALFAEENGLAIYRRLASEARAPWLFTEIGLGQGPEVRELFTGAGWSGAGEWHDLASILRVLAFRRS